MDDGSVHVRAVGSAKFEFMATLFPGPSMSVFKKLRRRVPQIDGSAKTVACAIFESRPLCRRWCPSRLALELDGLNDLGP